MKTKEYYVYILSNEINAVLYVGVTNDVMRRVYEHKNKLLKGFTNRYNVTKLIYVENCQDIRDALAREKQLKRWRKEKKINLIRTQNPDFKDLYNS